MRARLFPKQLSQRAPVIIAGVVFCVGLALAATSCDRSRGTPHWETSGGSASAATDKPVSAGVFQEPDSTPRSEPAIAADISIPSGTRASTEGLRFIAYNVRNWLTMDRYADRKMLKSSPKAKSEREAVVAVLAENSPDVIGLCEIGKPHDLAEIQQSLKAAGLDLPYSQYTGGTDPVRHLGLLSRFPITSTAKPAVTEFKLSGQTFGINRGFLDATIKAHGKSYRFVGVHLKSKREVEDVDQEYMRIHEARLLRRHVDAILQKDSGARLIVYGDFNDTRPSKAFKAVTGSFNDPGYLTAIPFRDSRGESWTYYWELHDAYSRIDFVTVTRALRPEVDFRASRIIDDRIWNEASDHRPLLAIFR